MGPTLVAYLRGVAGTVEATTAAAAVGMAGALWLAAKTKVGVAVIAVVGATAVAAVGVAAAMAVGAAVVVAGSGSGLDPPAGVGEEWRTRGLNLCPPLVLTMLGPEKGRRWREWEEEDLK